MLIRNVPCQVKTKGTSKVIHVLEIFVELQILQFLFRVEWPILGC